MKQLDHRRRLIDSFVNAIYLFDDYLVITFNYKEGTKTITFAEIEEAFGSDLSSLTAPNKQYLRHCLRYCLFYVNYIRRASANSQEFAGFRKTNHNPSQPSAKAFQAPVTRTKQERESNALSFLFFVY